MSRHHNNEYRGTLTPAMAAAGINVARKNAKRLVSDAQLLLDAGRFPTAAALAALAIEESGKVTIIREIVLATSQDQLKAAWKKYRDHRSKNGLWILPALAAQGARKLTDFAVTVDRDAEHTAYLNSLKQIGFYSDCYGKNGAWSEPDVVIDEDLAKKIVDIALIFAKSSEASVRELEPWKEHLGPVWGTPEAPYALLRWSDAMHREGLSETTPAEYARFVMGEEAVSDWPAHEKEH